MLSKKQNLALSVAGIALAAGANTTAQAQCTTATTTITCDMTVTANDVQNAVTALGGNDIALIIATGATVEQPGTFFSVGQTGVVSITNNGTIGTDTAAVDIFYNGLNTSNTNTLAFTNAGTLFGGVTASQFGGDATIANSGSIAGGINFTTIAESAITYSGEGAVTGGVVNLSSRGNITAEFGGNLGTLATGMMASDLEDFFLTSNQFNSVPAEAPVVNGNTTTTNLGGNERVGGTATATVAAGATTGGADIRGIDGASLTVNGTMGADDDGFRDIDIESEGSNFNRVQVVFDDGMGNTSTTTTDTTTAVGGVAAMTIAEGGVVIMDDIDIEGLTASNLTVDGSLTLENFGRVDLDANSSDFVRTTVNTNDGMGNTSTTTTDTTTAVGGVAAMTIAEGGVVIIEDIGIDGRTASNLTVDGLLTIENFGRVELDTTNADDVQTTVNTNDGMGNTTFSFSRVNTEVAGTADLTVGETGTIEGGSVNIFAQGAATIANSGTINAGISASSFNDIFTNDQASTDDGMGNGTSSNASTSTQQASSVTFDNATGGVVGEEGGFVFVNLSSREVAATNSGTIFGSISLGADAFDTASNQSFVRENFVNTQVAFDSTSTASGGDATLVNESGGVIGESPDAPGVVFLSADDTASFTNRGRVNGTVTVRAEPTDSASENNTPLPVVTTDMTTMVVTTVTDVSNSNSTVVGNGTAEIVNDAAGIIVGNITADGNGGASVVNNGSIIGRTTVQSFAADTSSTFESTTTEVFTPGTTADSGTVTTFSSTRTETDVSSGGDVSGTYAGTHGALQFIGAANTSRDGTITQTANGNSNAVISGTVFGTFSGSVVSASFGNPFQGDLALTETVSSELVQDSDGDDRSFTSNSATTATYTRGTGTSSVSVTADAEVTGSVQVSSIGSASVTTSGLIGNDISAFLDADGGRVVTNTVDIVENFDEDGVSTDRTTTDATTNTRSINTGTVTVAVNGGEVEDDVFITGAGGAATFTLAADAAVLDDVNISNASSAAETETRNRTVTTTVTPMETTVVTVTENTDTDAGGNASATIAGVMGREVEDIQDADDFENGSSLFVGTNAGNASASVTGQVGGNITVSAEGFATTFNSEDTRVDGTVTAFMQSNTSTASGGTATFTASGADSDIPVNFGDISVRGFGGSDVTVGANSTVLADGGQSLFVGSVLTNSTDMTTFVFDETTQTGSIGQQTSTNVGSDSTVTNAGQIGRADNSNSSVSVISRTVGTVGNTGTIFGSVSVDSIFQDLAVTTTIADANDVSETQTVDRTYTAVGGTGTVTNSNLIGGNVTVGAVTGTVNNTGVVGGGVFFGQRVDNFTTQTQDTRSQFGDEEITGPITPFVQNYTLNQSAFVEGTINVGGVLSNRSFTDEDFVQTSNASGNRVQTSTINADIQLNDGSVTGGILAEMDLDTGARLTNTNVTLNGSGFVGFDENGIFDVDLFGGLNPFFLNFLGTGLPGTPFDIGLSGTDTFLDLATRFAAINADFDENDFNSFINGVANTGIRGVETLTKTGDGTFVISGPAFDENTSISGIDFFTVDVGAFNIDGGEIQLNISNFSPALVSEQVFFGIHGDVTNSGTLVLGTRIDVEPERFAVDGGLQLINGVDVLHRGNYTQTSTGTLAVGILPSLVRVGLNEPAFVGGGSLDPLSQLVVGVDNSLFTTSEDLLGPFGELSGSIMVEGDLNLAGTVELVSPTRGIFVDGESVDFAMVTGTVTVSANTSFTSDSNFVSFGLGQRDEGGMTVLSATANRAGFDTAATSENGAAVGAAMTAALPGMVTTISNAVDGNIGLGGEAFRNAQDLANLVVGFDTLLTMEQVGQALDDISSGAQYGTLTAIRTTAPFLGAMDPGRVTQGDGRFNVWASIQRESVDFEGDTNVGSENLESDSFGLSAGIGILTEGGEWGLGFGYGETEAEADDLSFVADAETWMIGAFAQQDWRGFTFSGDVVFAWSEWVADRDLGVLSREAFSEFDSKEIRTDIAGSYMFDFDQGWVAPFAEVSFRYFNFDGFTEEGAGSLNLIVEDAENTVINPIIGARAGSSYAVGGAVIRPELLLSYTFQGDNEALRDVAASFAPDTEFRLEGVDPEGFLTVGGGINADFSRNAGAFVRGSFSPGNNYETANITAGVQIRF